MELELSPRDLPFAVLTVLGLAFSGCGLEHGKGGIIDKAIAEDAAQQRSIEVCTDGKRWAKHAPSLRDCTDRDSRPKCKPDCYGAGD